MSHGRESQGRVGRLVWAALSLVLHLAFVTLAARAPAFVRPLAAGAPREESTRAAAGAKSRSEIATLSVQRGRVPVARAYGDPPRPDDGSPRALPGAAGELEVAFLASAGEPWRQVLSRANDPAPRSRAELMVFLN